MSAVPSAPIRRNLLATLHQLLTPASAPAEDARQAGAEPLNGNGFYRFKIGDFQATVTRMAMGRFRSGQSSL